MKTKSPLFGHVMFEMANNISTDVSIRQFDRRVWSSEKRKHRYVFGVIYTLIVHKFMGLNEVTWREYID